MSCVSSLLPSCTFPLVRGASFRIVFPQNHWVVASLDFGLCEHVFMLLSQFLADSHCLAASWTYCSSSYGFRCCSWETTVGLSSSFFGKWLSLFWDHLLVIGALQSPCPVSVCSFLVFILFVFAVCRVSVDSYHSLALKISQLLMLWTLSLSPHSYLLLLVLISRC